MFSDLEKKKLRMMINEDLVDGDVTTESIVPDDVFGYGEILADESGFVVGLPEFEFIFNELDVELESEYSNGDRVESGEVIGVVEGFVGDILRGERVALNILCHLSGVATATREMVEIVSGAVNGVKIAATRKTTPLLRSFEKRAVSVVGGEPHRENLGDFVLIKDNHLEHVESIKKAIELAQRHSGSRKIEIEVESQEDAVKAVRAGCDIVMLDNFKPYEVLEAVKYIEKTGLRDKVLIEVSGGINPSNLDKYASTGVDIVSSSYITMKAPSLDLKIDLVKK
ncbi:carboxylating nicotinate-nucleotide diphosphorylase [Methanonatronarchaeum sp. AMET-Sl]|uniref:carboxylating nicotinate-nucleotide diphosphorylase n=1 Tax=Methanonatronarchaeum sp. AMET-Sl TaxID=3037654 RepID=UPI00244D9952|nr:carboxylating nicotinate-nucleotide diphosphorylase [Methanonatronarchaeum sp. AMET-Sl]WGI17035.1 carboxylating nicotinate-nucleotide diphosphorylase [Methanonatronarchaeum sp. AMET-Sl]